MSFLIRHLLESSKIKTLEVLKPPKEIRQKLKNEFVFGEKEEDLLIFRQKLKSVSFEEVKNIINKFLVGKIAEDKTSKFIFGLKNNNLEGFVSRGWKVENLLEDFQLFDDAFIIEEQTFEKIKREFG